MVSQVNPDVPSSPAAYTADMRDNFRIIKAEIEELQAAGGIDSLPLIGGTLTGPLQLPNGSAAVPSLALGVADGTGLSRSANALIFAVQGSSAMAMIGQTCQFYNDVYMLNHPIKQVADATAAGDALNMRTADVRYAPIVLAAEVAKLKEIVATLQRERQQPDAVGRGMRTDLMGAR
jgi:hypothetical protein